VIEYLVAGTIFGLSAGFGPGPLMTLVISETLRGGTRAGLKVAVAPLLTDGPILVLALALVGGVAEFDRALGAISLCGAAVVVLMGISTMRAPVPDLAAPAGRGGSLLRGAVVNLLNPHPWIFWLAVGAPTLLRARVAIGMPGPVVFVTGLYACLVGGKMVVAFVVGRTRHFMSPRVYRITMIVLGVLLLGFAGVLVRDALQLFGVGREADVVYWPSMIRRSSVS